MAMFFDGWSGLLRVLVMGICVIEFFIAFSMCMLGILKLQDLSSFSTTMFLGL